MAVEAVCGRLTWYDVLGILPGASADEVRSAYEARMRLLAANMISGAPPNVVTAANRARAWVEAAWRVLGDPRSRARYDEEADIQRRGGGLVRPEATPPERGWAGLDDVLSEEGGLLSAMAGVLARFGSGLIPGRAASRRVIVPDVRGLFIGPCRDAVGGVGLHMQTVQLTEHPLPVEGLVVDQSPPAGAKVGQSQRLTVQVWHPPRRAGVG
jgi:hypothetical protein